MQSLKSKIEKITKCELTDDSLILKYYSVDSSYYKIKPKVVAFPKSENQVIEIIKFAYQNKIGITSRGAGTGLVGSALGKEIIIDFKKMNNIKILKNSIIVQPGVLKGVLDEKIKSKKKFFAPNPSVGKYCSLGGMIGTNASGSHSIKYGSVIDNLLEVTIIDGKGRKIKLPNNDLNNKKIHKIAKQIELKKYPKVSKNSCGYRLDSVINIKNTHKVIAGSEGTLGIVVSAKFKTYDIPKKKILMIITYDSMKNIQKDCITILESKPVAIEYLDFHTLKNIKYRFPKNTKAALFVELDACTAKKYKEIVNLIKGNIVITLSNTKEIKKWWDYRNLALAFSLQIITKEKITPHIIEDVAIPIKKLEQLFMIVKKINKKYTSKMIIYGHAGNGNLHIRIILKKRSNKIIQNITDKFFDEILKLNGTITAEHGDGLARSEYVKLQYGRKNYQTFIKLKKLLDPKNILNPNKIITKKTQMTKNIEYPI